MVMGSQSLYYNMAIAWSHTDSEITPHSYGPGAPPNVRCRATIVSSLSGSCVHVWMAVLAFKWYLQYADL